jgi:hypothetical protein
MPILRLEFIRLIVTVERKEVTMSQQRSSSKGQSGMEHC